MNLLYTITAYPPSIGGAQYYAHQLARVMAIKHGVQVAILWDTNRTDWLLGTTLKASDKPHDYIHEGIPVHRMGFSRMEKAAMLPAVMAYYPLMDLALPLLSSITQRHLEFYASSASLIHNVRVGREPLSLASLQTAHRRDIPFFLTPLHHPRWKGWLYRKYHHIYQQADGVFALTQAEKQILIGLGVKENRISITGMGPILTDSANGESFRQKYNLEQDPVILFIGQKYEYKGPSALLDSAQIVWHRFPEARFVFIGPRTNYSERLFSAMDDSRVLEIGSLSLQEKTDALAACTLLCVPSAQESFGGVFTEAWSLGKPVIGCSIPAVSELIEDGTDGFLVKQVPQEIAERVMALIADHNMAQRMGISGQTKVNEHYTWQKLSALTEQAYLRVLA